MTSSAQPTHPEVLWAQRGDHVTVVINIPDLDASSMALELKPASMSFTGHTTTPEQTQYHFCVDFFEEIDLAASKYAPQGRGILCMLQKKNGGYWPRLTKEKVKLHWLRTDFSRWRDEDDEEEAAVEEADPYAGMDFSQFGSMGGFDGGLTGGQFDADKLAFNEVEDEDEDEDGEGETLDMNATD